MSEAVLPLLLYATMADEWINQRIDKIYVCGMFIVYYFHMLASYKEVHKSTANYNVFSKLVDVVVTQ